MKSIIIGDIHGRDIWLDIIDQPFDRVIFLGDYVDTHHHISGLEQIDNLRSIIAFKEANPTKVTLLIGNHDYHYFPEIGQTGTSGYQPTMAKSFEYEFDTYRNFFQIATVDQGVVCSHAGITKTWLQDVDINHLEIHSTVDQINDLFRGKPRKFNFYLDDTSWYGDNIHQSPIWVRPDALVRDSINAAQVVGHTTQNSINTTLGKLYLIDTLGTSQEYLIISDGQISVGKV